MKRHTRENDDGTTVPCICPVGNNHSALYVDTAAPVPAGAAGRAPRPRSMLKPADPAVYQPATRAPIRTRPCPGCRVTCEVVITEKNGKEVLLDVIGPGESDAAGTVVMVKTPAGPRARFYSHPDKVPEGSVRRRLHMLVCANGKKPVEDRWVRRPQPGRTGR